MSNSQCSGQGCFNCVMRPHSKYGVEGGFGLKPFELWMGDDDFVNHYNSHSFSNVAICEVHKYLLLNLRHDLDY